MELHHTYTHHYVTYKANWPFLTQTGNDAFLNGFFSSGLGYRLIALSFMDDLHAIAKVLFGLTLQY